MINSVMSGHRLGYVPPPLPDETLYSVLAGHCRLAPDADLTRRLLGPTRTRARFDWPVGLDLIAHALPPGLNVTATQLLAEHTLAPIHLPFIDAARRRALVEAMIQVNAGEPSKISGARSTCVETPRCVRVCRQCMQDDVKFHGRAYLHRVHQFAGVIVCPDHPGSVLHDTNLFRAETYLRKAYIDISGVSMAPPVARNLSPRELATAAGIAQAVQRLLDGEGELGDPEHIRQAMRAGIIAQGYVTPGRKVDLVAFHRAFARWFTPNLAIAVGVPRPVSPGNGSWLYRCLTRKRDAIHPLLPILIAQFLETDVHQMLVRKPGSLDRPITCRAPRPPGVSKAYARFEARKATLKKLWPRKELRLAQLARQLGVDGLTVRRWAVILDLPFPRPGPRVVFRPTERAHRPDVRQLIRTHRAAWRRALDLRIPGPSRNPFSRKLYSWLSRYDRIWLRQHMPKQRRSVRIDWSERDRSLVEKVEHVATALLGCIPPIRVSRTRLAHALGHAEWLLQRQDQIPLTSMALSKNEESYVAFAARRLAYLHNTGALSPRRLSTALRKYPELRRAKPDPAFHSITVPTAPLEVIEGNLVHHQTPKSPPFAGAPCADPTRK